jgi:hypothetical protein
MVMIILFYFILMQWQMLRLLYVKKQDETTTKLITELERKRSFNRGKRMEDEVNESEMFRYTTDADVFVLSRFLLKRNGRVGNGSEP